MWKLAGNVLRAAPTYVVPQTDADIAVERDDETQTAGQTRETDALNPGEHDAAPDEVERTSEALS